MMSMCAQESPHTAQAYVSCISDWGNLLSCPRSWIVHVLNIRKQGALTSTFWLEVFFSTCQWGLFFFTCCVFQLEVYLGIWQSLVWWDDERAGEDSGGFSVPGKAFKWVTPGTLLHLAFALYPLASHLLSCCCILFSAWYLTLAQLLSMYFIFMVQVLSMG